MAHFTLFGCNSLFWHKKLCFKAKLTFSDFFVDQLFCVDAKIYTNSTFVLFCQQKLKKRKVKYLRTLAKFQLAAWPVQKAQFRNSEQL